MKLLRRMLSRLRGMLYGRRRETELIEELESHLEMQIEDNVRAGMTLQEARRAARLKFGNVESVKESYRDQRGIPFLETLLADLRYAVRQLRSNPGFTITIVVTIALAIGANTAVFSIINTIVLKPLPVSDPESLVWFVTKYKTESSGNPAASPAAFVHWRAQSSVFENVSAFLRAPLNYTGSDVSEIWNAMSISPETFRVFRMPMLLGREFLSEEERADGARVAILSNGLWKRHFAGDLRILGKTVSLSGEPYTVVGIVADSPGFFEASFDSPATDVYVPFRIDPNTTDLAQIFYVVGRLKPGVTPQQAKQRLRASTADFRSTFPTFQGIEFSFMTIREAFNASEQRPYFVLLMLTVNGVLLIACANAANLLLARAVGRKREIGVRIAVGAGRRRIIRQLLTESVLLSLAGGAAGLVLANIQIKEFFPSAVGGIPAIWKIGIDWRVVMFTFGLSVVTAVVFGLVPAFHASRVDLNTVLKDSGSRWGTGRQNKLRSALVVSEIGLAVVLLIVCALTIRSLMALYRVEPGFQAKHVYVMYSSFFGSKYQKPGAVPDALRNGLDRIRTMPGVEAAGTTIYAPLTGNLGMEFNIVGRVLSDGSATGHIGWTPVSPGYFDVFKIPVKRGRDLTVRDAAGSTPVVLINETMAKTFWKDGDPLSDRILINGGAILEGEPPRQIIGIVGDVRQTGLNAVPEPRVYVPQAQLAEATNEWLVRLSPNMWVVRTKTGTREPAAAAQEELRKTLGVAFFEMDSMSNIVRKSTEDDRGLVMIMTLFSGLALLLAAVGIYGVMSYTVEQQQQEIGIRLALGAEASNVRNMVVRHGLRLTAIGVVLGLAAAWELMMLMEGLLFGVQPRDPLVFVTVPAALSAVALLAVWLPATRASRVNPMDSLRCE